MKLYDVKAKLHGDSYDAVSLLSLRAEPIFREFAEDHGWEVSGMVSSLGEEDEASEAVIVLHVELNAPKGSYISVDFVRYENNRLQVDNKVVIRAFSPRGELVSSVLRGLKLVSLPEDRRADLLRSELDRLAGFIDLT